MRKLIKGITKTYLYATSAYFTYISTVFFISTYKNYKREKEKKVTSTVLMNLLKF